jgi:hypothetical protein
MRDMRQITIRLRAVYLTELEKLSPPGMRLEDFLSQLLDNHAIQARANRLPSNDVPPPLDGRSVDSINAILKAKQKRERACKKQHRRSKPPAWSLRAPGEARSTY